MDKLDDPLADAICRAMFEQPLGELHPITDAACVRAAAAVRSFMLSDEVVERALHARYHAAGSFWPDAVSEGMQRVERMIMEKTIDGALRNPEA